MNAALPSLTSSTSLMCRACGASLPPNPEGEILRCTYCGTTQRIVDARAFVDQISLQINSFLRQAMPLGLPGGVGAGVVDPVARHNLFVQGVRPMLDTEFRELRFRCFNLLSHGQMALPFTSASGWAAQDDPKQAFLYQAKVRSVGELAVDDESRQHVTELDAVSTVYAHLLTNAGFLLQSRPERYPFLARNCREASEAVAKLPKYAALQARLQGLAGVAEGLDLVTQGRAAQGRAQIAAALPLLDQAKTLAVTNFDQSVMIGGIDEDLALARASLQVADLMALSPAGSSGRALQALQSYLQWIAAPLPGQAAAGGAGRIEYLLGQAALMRRAQFGQGTVRVVRGPGEVNLPFWVVEVPYSFKTGVLWKARGVEVSETMLVASSFPLERVSPAGFDPARPVTDVFAARGPSTWRARVSGQETSISGGGWVRNLVAGSAALPLAGLASVPPLSTPDEANQLVQEYLLRSRQKDPEIEQKLRLSSPRVLDLLYVPVSPGAPGSPTVPVLGPLSPVSVGDRATLFSLAFS